jgi:site-specific DNA-methyltransferase (adenine-specific)
MSTLLIRGDTLEELRDLDNLSTDIVFFDPPYNVKKKYDGYSDNRPASEYVEWMTNILAESHRVSRKGVAVYISGFLVPLYLSLMPNSHLIIVHKKAAGVCSGNYMLQYHAIVSTIRPVIKCRDVWDDIRLPGEGYFFREGRTSNPGMTGVELTKRVLHHFSQEGDRILDPFMGSGTTAVAATLMNRHAIGFDQSLQYLTEARERVEYVSNSPVELEA